MTSQTREEALGVFGQYWSGKPLTQRCEDRTEALKKLLTHQLILDAIKRKSSDWKQLSPEKQIPIRFKTFSLSSPEIHAGVYWPPHTVGFRGKPPLNSDSKVFCNALRKAKAEGKTFDIQADGDVEKGSGWPLEVAHEDARLKFRGDPEIPPRILADWIVRSDIRLPNLLQRGVTLDELDV